MVFTRGKVKVTATIDLTRNPPVGTSQTFQLHGKQTDLCRALS